MSTAYLNKALEVPVEDNSLIPKIFQPLESVLGSIGLSTPLSRMMFTTAIGSGVEYYVKPRYAYNSDGSMRKSSLITSEPGATYLHAGMIPFVFGILTALYI